MKKGLALCLAALLTLSLAACGGPGAPGGASSVPSAPPAASAEEPGHTLRVAALKGPTAMGLMGLMSPETLGEERYGAQEYTLAGSPDEITPQLVKGELDVACVPANLAAVLYQKTQGQIVTLAVNTLGVLYIAENGDAVQSLADLKGKTIVASGKGSTPEYALRYLLAENGLDMEKDLTVEWKSEHAECVTALAAGTATVALLPQPFLSAAQGKLPELRMALDLTKEWDALDNGSQLITGVVVARREVLEQYPQEVSRFLEGYAKSVDWVNGNNADAAVLIGEQGIVDAAVAEKALPYCNIVLLTGADMKNALSGYLDVLHQQAPEAVGGALPEPDFYYGG